MVASVFQPLGVDFNIRVQQYARGLLYFTIYDRAGNPLDVTQYMGLKLAAYIVVPQSDGQGHIVQNRIKIFDATLSVVSATNGQVCLDLSGGNLTTYTGMAGTFMASLRLWGNAPAVASTAALVLVAGNVTAGTHSYKYTNVINGIETAGSPKSNVVTNDGTHQQNTLTNVLVGPPGTTARKVYRTVAGDTGSYLLVGTISDNVTTTFTDNVADGSLGAAMPADTTARPPDEVYPGTFTVVPAVVREEA